MKLSQAEGRTWAKTEAGSLQQWEMGMAGAQRLRVRQAGARLEHVHGMESVQDILGLAEFFSQDRDS